MDAKAENEEDAGNFKSDRPITKNIAKKTSWENFDLICSQINREKHKQHILDYFVSELGTSGHFGGNENLILNGKFKSTAIAALYRSYLNDYVKCGESCKSLNTTMTKD